MTTLTDAAEEFTEELESILEQEFDCEELRSEGATIDLRLTDTGARFRLKVTCLSEGEASDEDEEDEDEDEDDEETADEDDDT
jgi:hypothetical protein